MPPRQRVFGGKDGVSNVSAVAKPVHRSVTTREMTKRRLARNADVPTDELLKSDSDDENYDDKAKPERSPRKARKTPGKGKSTRGKKPAGRGGRRGKSQKRANQYADSEDDDEIQDSELEDDFLIEEEEEEPEAPVPLGRSGRPKRGAAPAVLREESDEESMASASSSNDDEGEEEEEEEEATRSAADNASSAPTRIVVLKFRNSSTRWKLGQHEALPADDPEPQQPPPPTRRITRATSATPSQAAAGSQRPTAGGKGPLISGGRNHPPKVRGRGASAEPQRRSGRLTQSNEPMAELSNSGNVVIINTPPVPSLIAEESSFEEPREEPKEEPKEEPEEEPKEEPKEELNEAVEEAKTPEPEPLSNGHSSQLEPVDEVIAEEQAPAAAAADPASRDDTGHEADEDEDDGPTRRTRTRTTTSRAISTPSPRTLRSAGGDPSSAEKGKASEATGARRLNRRGKPVRGASRKAKSDDDDYEEVGEDEHSDDSDSSHPRRSPVKAKSYSHDDEGDDSDVRSSRSKKRSRGSGSEEVESQVELQQELEDLQPSPKRTRRTQRRAAQFSGNESNAANEPRLRPRTEKRDYRLYRPELANVMDDNDVGTSSPSKRKMGGEPAKSLFDTNGPFGGGSVVPFSARGAGLIDSDSDSSDDEAIRRRGPGAGAGLGGIVGMTPTGAHAPGLLPGIGQTHNTDPMGAPANLGKVTRPGKNALADADPLGVSPDVTFDSVGGLDDRIQQLKEMVMLPLMYPEIFMAKKVTPPRGVLFHGPPGTGKTLMARAVASSFTGADGKKVTFYMRKGADCLSKWVGEAERQLRLLFEEARNNQPSIIFFDEIDGLAPVRSSKQEQIHASIVSTLLALMDGMDGRGQVVVIGATNRPDAVDPALRRPGRFDREFYFPLPTTEARRAIIDIHSRGWQPPLSDKFKDELAVLTKGYGGADLRALCTEAALNAMQRTYPQIYKSLDKLKVDPNNVVVTARDFMMSLKKITPSSERSSTSSAAPLPDHIKPLLSKRLEEIKDRLRGIFPEFKRLSPLEEAEYEDDIMDAEEGFEREMMMESKFYRAFVLV
jgi:SpoVK/Ycf46/Vps4 family AAA+-type ATPase